MGGPADERRRGDATLGKLPALNAVGVHEVKAGAFIYARKHGGAGGGVNGVPSHVGQNVGVEAFDYTRPFAAAGSILPMLDPVFEKYLHSDANPHDRPGAGEAFANEPGAVDGRKAPHAGGECAHTGDEEPVGGEDFAGVVGDGGIGADAGESAVGGSEITGAVIEDGYCGGHRRSFLGNL